MAMRRMFSKEVTNSDFFLDMPLSAQALYYHLGMNADDDGFVSPKSIMRLIQANEDDLKILLMKGFAINFEDSVIVITHWKTNNEIKRDRYKKTVYQNHLKFLGLDEGKYVRGNILVPGSIQVGGTGKVRLGKDRIGDTRPAVGPSQNSLPNLPKENTLPWVVDFWNKRNSIPPGIDSSGMRNQPAVKYLLPKCIKWTSNLDGIFKKAEKNFSREEITLAITKYMTEILNRDPAQDYATHRFTIGEFLKQSNGLEKFINN